LAHSGVIVVQSLGNENIGSEEDGGRVLGDNIDLENDGTDNTAGLNNDSNFVGELASPVDNNNASGNDSQAAQLPKTGGIPFMSFLFSSLGSVLLVFKKKED
jgi:hypothetical protein